MVSGRSQHASRIWASVGIIGGETVGLAEAVRGRDAPLAILGHRIRRETRGLRFRQLETREDRLGGVVGVGGRVATRPDLDHSVLRWPAPLPPEHGVDVGQMGQRHVRGQGVGGAGQVQLSAVLVYLVVLKSAERLVRGEDHLPAILPVAVIMLLLVGVRATVVASTLLEEGVRDALLGLMLLQMFPHLARILERCAATVQPAVMVFPAQVTGAIGATGHQIRQFDGGELLAALLLLLLLLLLVHGHRGTPACRGDGGRGRRG